MKVLVVEDEEKIASFIVKGLSAAGYETEHVTTGGAAIERVVDADVLVLDLGLPDLDGMEVLRRVREGGLDTQVIVLTARAELDDRVEGLERGADGAAGRARADLGGTARTWPCLRTGAAPCVRPPSGGNRPPGTGRTSTRTG